SRDWSSDVCSSDLSGFKAGSVAVLVATDIAARGLDIDQLPQVINFELPNVPEDYVHRIGRTGRAGASGAALSLVDAEEVKLLADIEKLIKRKIDQLPAPDFVANLPIVPVQEERPPRPAGRSGAAKAGGRREPAPAASRGGNRPSSSRPAGADRSRHDKERSGPPRSSSRARNPSR